MRLSFIDWKPDQDDFGNQGLVVADNVLHDTEGYKPLTKQTAGAFSTTIPFTVSGQTILSLQAKPIGNAGHLALAVLEPSAGATTVSLVIGVHGETSFDTVISGTLASLGSARIEAFSIAELDQSAIFVALAKVELQAGTIASLNISGQATYTFEADEQVIAAWDFPDNEAPDGVVCGTIGKFVFVSLASDRLTVQWCAIGDPSDWPTPLTDEARSKQAGSETLNPAHGFVTGITGNEFFGYVFQERAITRFTYIGGDIVFSVDTFEVGRGCFTYNRFARIDDTVFFESEFGRHALTDGQITDIGLGITDDSYTPAATTEQKNVAVNPAIHTVFFEDENLAFNYKTNQFTRLPAFDGQGYYSIDEADGVIGQVVFSGSVVDLQTSTGGVEQTAIIETGETDLNEGGRAVVQGVRPIVRGGTVSTRVGIRNSFDEDVTYSTGTSVNARTGMANFRDAENRAEGRYQRVRLVISGGFETAMGADVEFRPAGRV